MKITDPDVIKNGERDLIDAVKENLDLNTIKEIMQNKIHTKTLLSKGGEIVVHNNEIAFKLDFSFEIQGSLMFDRQGNYIPESDEPKSDEPKSDEPKSDEPKSDEIEEEQESESTTKEDNLTQNDILDDDIVDDDIVDDDILDDDIVDDDILDDDIVDDDIVDDDIIDDDINDILKESQELWETKKN